MTIAKFFAALMLGSLIWTVLFALFNPVFVILCVVIGCGGVCAIALRHAIYEDRERDRRMLDLVDQAEARKLRMCTRWEGR